MASSPRREDTTPHTSGFAADLPAKQGMYNPAFEKDACGLAMVATLRGEPGHDIVQLALEALRNLEHRGAIGSDAGTGDGAGILTQMPDAFLRAVTEFDLPPAGEYAAGMAFLPRDDHERAAVEGGRRTDRRRRGADGARLARGADGGGAPRQARLRRAPRIRATVRLAPRRRRRARARGHRPRPPCLPAAQACTPRARRLLRVAERPHPRVQGHGHDPPARAVLPRSAGRALRERARRRALALLDEHVPVVAARAAAAHARPQRRDQHRRRQPQLDARPPVAARVGARRRHPSAAADLHRGCERLGVVRRGAGTARP